MNKENDLREHIIFYKEQIIYYQSLLQNSIEFQYNLYGENIKNQITGVSAVNKQEILEPCIQSSKEISKETSLKTSKLKQKMKQMKNLISENIASDTNKLSMSEESEYVGKRNISKDELQNRFSQEQEDIRKLRIKQFDARKYLQKDEESIKKIRAMEEKLKKDGKTPEEARIETRKKLYPESIPKFNKDGSTNRSHKLLALNDSDSDSDSDSDLDELQKKNITKKNIVEKINELFENEDPFDIIELGDNVNPDDIEEEVELASFEN